jgi:hypothetical protein
MVFFFTQFGYSTLLIDVESLMEPHPALKAQDVTQPNAEPNAATTNDIPSNDESPLTYLT